MSPIPYTPMQAAEALYALVPHEVTPAMLEEYGIEATPAQTRQLTRELLSLNLFWIRHALPVALKDADRKRVLNELCERLISAWEPELGQEGEDVGRYFQDMEERYRAYDRLVQEGAEPPMIASEAAAILESEGVVKPEDRRKLLALFIDLVPVDEIGEAATDLVLL